jgi:A/G-specific adenine glycosylase
MEIESNLKIDIRNPMQKQLPENTTMVSGEAKNKQVGCLLVEWFRQFGDKYPFRETNDAYRILVSEILLRKTTARQVSSVYSTFFKNYPNANELFKGDIGDIQRIIRPLGIRSRAQDLKKIAELIVSRGGSVPEDYEELDKIKGVGVYIAGCVMVFAYGKRYPLVDSNVERVLQRIFEGKMVSSKNAKKNILGLYSEVSPIGYEKQFHYAIIDLAHKFCRPKEPRCHSCPIFELCDFANGISASMNS